MTSFQAALLNEDQESEEELLSIISHLVVCAIEDPGVPFPKMTLTILGQNLRQADITNTNLSEILRIFISARASFEIKLLQGVSPPEPKDRKEAVMGLFANADKSYMDLLEENKTFQLAQLMKDKPFLCLNVTQKTEILSFLCNELLNNKAVVNQIEVTMENVHIMKRKKIALDLKVKKLRILHNRKFRYMAGGDMAKFMEDHLNVSRSNNTAESENGEDDSLSVMSEVSGSETPSGRGGKGKRKGKKQIKAKRKSEEVEEEEEILEEEDDMDFGSDVDEEKEEDVSIDVFLAKPEI